MTAESLLARYRADQDFRARMDAAESAEDAIRVAAEHGIVASASDIAGLGAGQLELDEDMLNEVAGGRGNQDVNISFN